MKGVVVERARPSNCIDVYPLIKQAAKEGVFYGNPPATKSLEQFYYSLLTKELPDPGHFYYLAKRGRGYLGCLHAVIARDRWSGMVSKMWVDFVFVGEKKRKCGVGKKLIERLMKDAGEIGIKDFDFLCREEQLEYFQKKFKAEKLSVLMRVKNAAIS